MQPLSTIDIIDKSTLSYAQNREDLIIHEFFKNLNDGFYVDVGANSPIHDSVTKIFYDKGWSGINIEPIHSHYKSLLHARPRDTNLNIGISSDERTLKLREYEGDGLSTFSREMMKQYEAHKTRFTESYTDYNVKTRSLSSIFEELKPPQINFMKIDVEGFEYEVIVSNDWLKFRPMLLCIEANHVENDWKAFLRKNNYTQVFSDGINEYYVDKKNPNISKDFSYVSAILDRMPIVDHRNLLLFNEATDIINDRYNQYKKLQKYSEELEDKIAVLEERQHNLRTYFICRIMKLLNLSEKEVSLDRTGVRSGTKNDDSKIRAQLKTVNRYIVKALSATREHTPYKIAWSAKQSKSDLLSKAKKYDIENYRKYNLIHRESRSLKVYSYIKSNTKKLLKKIKSTLGGVRR